jgi:hypothetical protein
MKKWKRGLGVVAVGRRLAFGSALALFALFAFDTLFAFFALFTSFATDDLEDLDFTLLLSTCNHIVRVSGSLDIIRENQVTDTQDVSDLFQAGDVRLNSGWNIQGERQDHKGTGHVVDLRRTTTGCGRLTNQRYLNRYLHLAICVNAQEIDVLDLAGYGVNRNVAHKAQFLAVCAFNNNVDGSGLTGTHQQFANYWRGSLEDQWITARAVKMQRREATSAQSFVLAAKGSSWSCFK